MNEFAVWYELGDIYLKAASYDEAIEAYAKAIEMAPNFGWPYRNLACAYLSKGRFAEAVPLLLKSIELLHSKAEKAISFNKLGDAYRHLGEYQNALEAYQQADTLSGASQDPFAPEKTEQNPSLESGNRVSGMEQPVESGEAKLHAESAPTDQGEPHEVAMLAETSPPVEEAPLGSAPVSAAEASEPGQEEEAQTHTGATDLPVETPVAQGECPPSNDEGPQEPPDGFPVTALVEETTHTGSMDDLGEGRSTPELPVEPDSGLDACAADLDEAAPASDEGEISGFPPPVLEMEAPALGEPEGIASTVTEGMDLATETLSEIIVGSEPAPPSHEVAGNGPEQLATIPSEPGFTEAERVPVEDTPAGPVAMELTGQTTGLRPEEACTEASDIIEAGQTEQMPAQSDDLPVVSEESVNAEVFNEEGASPADADALPSALEEESLIPSTVETDASSDAPDLEIAPSVSIQEPGDGGVADETQASVASAENVDYPDPYESDVSGEYDAELLTQAAYELKQSTMSSSRFKNWVQSFKKKPQKDELLSDSLQEDFLYDLELDDEIAPVVEVDATGQPSNGDLAEGTHPFKKVELGSNAVPETRSMDAGMPSKEEPDTVEAQPMEEEQPAAVTTIETQPRSEVVPEDSAALALEDENSLPGDVETEVVAEAPAGTSSNGGGAVRETEGPVSATMDAAEPDGAFEAQISGSENGKTVQDQKSAFEWNCLGNVYLKAGSYDEAIAAYTNAIEMAPKVGWPYRNLATAYFYKGMTAVAIPLFKRSIELLTNSSEKAASLNKLGDAYRQLGDYQNAMVAYQNADDLSAGIGSILQRARMLVSNGGQD